MLGLRAGEVFVHRNLGNQIPSTDLNCLSVLGYAVDLLDVRDIIVTGHYDCDAVRAAMQSKDLGVIENWFRCIRDVYRLHSTELDAIPDMELRHRKLVEVNVVEQCVNLYKTGVVQRKRLATAKPGQGSIAYPRIHPFVYDPSTGKLSRIPIDFEASIGKFKDIYSLYVE
jgi:carbonic anhydrase